MCARIATCDDVAEADGVRELHRGFRGSEEGESDEHGLNARTRRRRGGTDRRQREQHDDKSVPHPDVEVASGKNDEVTDSGKREMACHSWGFLPKRQGGSDPDGDKSRHLRLDEERNGKVVPTATDIRFAEEERRGLVE